MFIVTREWIFANQTPKGSWRRAQIEALGVPFKRSHGWIERMNGAQITDEQRRTFEQERVKQKAEQQGLFDQGQFA